MDWIKCSEQMPEVGERVIGWDGWAIRSCSYCIYAYAKTAKGRQPRFEVTGGIWHNVTHWMPMPKPPTE